MNCCSTKSSSEKPMKHDLYILSEKFRFSAQELIQYQNRFSRISKGKEMTLKKFRKSMGLLGFKSTSVLADRIFKCMDKNNNNKVNFEEFLEYMDVVMHGTKEEKCLQSYKLIASHQDFITYQEFSSWLKSLWKMFNTLTGTDIKSTDETIRSHFIAIDYKKDGVIDYEEYSKSAYNQPSMLSWLNYLNINAENPPEPEDPYRNRMQSIENNIQTCIEIVREKEMGKIQTPVVEVSYGSDYIPERGPKCISQMEFGHAGDIDSPSFYGSDSEISNTKVNKTVNSSIILEKLEELSDKINKLKVEQQTYRRNTVFNVPKIEKKKNKISWGDEDWNLILYMMLGIQKAVKAAPAEFNNQPQSEEFAEIAKFSLMPQKKQKNDQKVCKLKDFAPSVFARIRNLYQVESPVYLRSLGVEKIMSGLLRSEFSSLVGLISSGKSGSFFYFSDDGKYVLKTMSLGEFEFFKRILPDYYGYLAMFPNTLIQKFFGFHNIKYYKESEKVNKNFIIMDNLFSSGHEIHLRFDLKGSTVGRTTDPDEDFSIARKDIDFNRSGMKIKLSPGDKDAVIEQIRKDCQFFERLEIIDYSLLVGIHHLKDKKVDLNGLNHAYVSSDRQHLYFIGIIDILTLYKFKKKVENLVKSPFLGKDISCVPPKQYAARFFNYMQKIFE